MVRAWLLRSILTLVAMTSMVESANAQLAIDRLWIDLNDKGAARSDLVIRNESTDVYYISVIASEVINPGTPEEQRITLSDPEELGLLVTPNRLILRPNELRAIRVVSLNRELSKDRIYRVKINPEIGEISYNQKAQEDRGLALKLLAAFDVLVTVRPDGARADLLARRVEDRIEFINQGASNILLLDGQVCPPKGGALSETVLERYRSQIEKPQLPEEFAKELDDTADDVGAPTLELTEEGCIRLPGRRLYPGNTWNVVADDTAAIKFMVRRNANEDLRGLTVRCSANPIGFENSEFCQIGGSQAVAGAVASSPAPIEKELKL